ncbi:MAG TPA: acyltransferase [Pedomonas sp.]|uniref:acyltransferase family protein n=1 Tax=Pedomonas sp. TaxID=2976421 RepID=UPI002F3FADAE
MSLNNKVQERISVLRFLMIFGIVVLHTPQYVPIAQVGPGAFDFIKAFFQNALFRTTVPVLTFISGYLLFNSGLYLNPRKLAQKKFKTIVVPFLVFNLTLLLAAYLAQSRAGIALSYELTPFDPGVWLNAAFGLTTSPINYPLNFLRDLIVLMCLAPVFGLMLRTYPVLGLVCVSVLFYPDYDGYLLLRNTMAITFYLGGMAAIQKWNVLALDKYAPVCLLGLIGVCVAMVHFRIANTNYLALGAPFLIWPAAALLHGTGAGRWSARMSKYSFFIFVAHAPVLMATWLVYDELGEPVPYPLYWLAAPVITLGILVIVYKLALTFTPSVFSAILGLKKEKARSREDDRYLEAQSVIK